MASTQICKLAIRQTSLNVNEQAPEDRLLTLSREMLACAEAGDWDKLVELEHERLPLFRQVFEVETANKAELAQEVLSLDETTQSLARAGMAYIQNQILQMKNSGKANDAYQAVQELSPNRR